MWSCQILCQASFFIPDYLYITDVSCVLDGSVTFLSYPIYLFIFKFQTLYTYPENWRAFKAQIAAQYSGARLKVASSSPAFTFGQTNRTPEFLKNFPLGKVAIRKCHMCGTFVGVYLAVLEKKLLVSVGKMFLNWKEHV